MRYLLVGEAGAENDGASGVAIRRDMQHQGLTRVEVPDLDGGEAVPAGTLAFAQEVIDLRQRTTTAPGRRIAKSLTIPAVFRMRARARTAMIASESKSVISRALLTPLADDNRSSRPGELPTARLAADVEKRHEARNNLPKSAGGSAVLHPLCRC